jgi:FKBP-type peptidyl-prolyl cis-trans isomerase FkpA
MALLLPTLIRGFNGPISLAGRIGGVQSMAIRTSAVRMGLDTEEGKAWHALGFNIGTQLKDLQGSSETEVDDILSGIKAALMQEPPEVPLDEYVPKASMMMQERAAEKGKAMIEEGKKALEAAAAEDGATKTDSGLVVLIENEGSGASPAASDSVEVHYEGTLVDGSVFDSSYARGQPISFPLSGVIAGWTEGLQLMKVGGKAKLTIPYDLAYGERGSPPAIPPMATLIFTVELLDIK